MLKEVYRIESGVERVVKVAGKLENRGFDHHARH
jgi:hypothetical protein